MLKNIMTLFQLLKLIFQRLLWLVSVPLLSSMLVVFVDVDDTLLVSLVVIWHWKLCCPKGWIGINAGRIRGINSRIRGGEVQHTGVIPFLKKFEATVKCCTQNGV